MQHLRRFEIQTKTGSEQVTETELAAWRGEVEGVRVVPWQELFERSVLGSEAFRVTLVNAMGDDLEPLRSARLSTDTPTGVDVAKDNSLRTRLWRDTHTSPFEANVAVFELVVPIAMLRQIDRHRTVHVGEMQLEVIEDYDEFRKYSSRNEFSARYSNMPDMFYNPEPSRFRKKSVKNKQGSDEPLSTAVQVTAAEKMRLHSEISRNLYQYLLEMGVASEVARFVLPMNQVTKIRLQAALLNWFKFLRLRLAPDVQEETRQYAQAIAEGIKLLWPECWAVFEEHTLGALTLSRTERQGLHEILTRLQGRETTSLERRVSEQLLTRLAG